MMTMKDVPFFGNFLENLLNWPQSHIPLEHQSTYYREQVEAVSTAAWQQFLRSTNRERNVKKLEAKLDGATNKLLVI